MYRKIYNGQQSILPFLARFTAIFELCIKKQLVRENEFISAFPTCYATFKDDIRKKVGFASSNKQKEVLSRKGTTLAYNKSRYLVYDLCRHIRNSFCHMLIEFDKSTNQIHINDRNRGIATSRGWLSKETFLKFVKALIADYENNFTSKK